MQNIYTHINENKRETIYIIVIFIIVISLIGYIFGEMFSGDGRAFVPLALIFSGLSSFFSYYNSDKLVLAISGAKEVTPQENDYLHDLVDNMCIASGLPKPKLYIINDTAMNAFATGRDPKHAAMCFTSGIVSKLDKRELEGVIAHELSHIGNYDIRLMSVVSILVGTVTLLADWFTRGMFYGSKRKSDSNSDLGGLMLILGLVLIILSPIIATLIKLAVSRNREYLADASAALITRYPQGLANALKKLSVDREVLEAANGATAHLYISNPLRGNSANFLSSLFNTHPPIEDRIKRLETM